MSFDRVSQHRGNVVMLVEPNSSLRAANDDLKLRQALEFAGNKVRTVETTAELTRVIDLGKTDVVLVSWGDAGRLQEQMVNRWFTHRSPGGLQDRPGRAHGCGQARCLLCAGRATPGQATGQDRWTCAGAAREKPAYSLQSRRGDDVDLIESAIGHFEPALNARARVPRG